MEIQTHYLVQNPNKLRGKIEPKVRNAIKTIIDFDITTIEELKRATKYKTEICIKAFEHIENCHYKVVRSLTENNCYFVIDKEGNEFKFFVSNELYSVGIKYANKTIINTLIRLCF